MPLYLFSLLALLFCFATAHDDKGPTHGKGEEGKSMGPVAFMYPPDRLWTAANDNTGPCGSSEGPSNRTLYPLTQGSVALTIADEAWHVAFRIAYGNNPTTQGAFVDQVVNNITEIEPGHACYKIDQLEGITAGTNATFQLEYWADFEGENDGRNQSFFACADVTFADARDVTPGPCFNVTSDDFNAPTPTSDPKIGSTAPANTGSQAAPVSSHGLSGVAKAGIAIGAILGGLLVLGAIAFFLYRRGMLTGLRKRDSYELRAKELNAAKTQSTTTSV